MLKKHLLIKAVSLTLIICSILSFPSCKDDESDPPVEMSTEVRIKSMVIKDIEEGFDETLSYEFNYNIDGSVSAIIFDESYEGETSRITLEGSYDNMGRLERLNSDKVDINVTYNDNNQITELFFLGKEGDTFPNNFYYNDNNQIERIDFIYNNVLDGFYTFTYRGLNINKMVWVEAADNYSTSTFNEELNPFHLLDLPEAIKASFFLEFYDAISKNSVVELDYFSGGFPDEKIVYQYIYNSDGYATKISAGLAQEDLFILYYTIELGYENF